MPGSFTGSAAPGHIGPRETRPLADGSPTPGSARRNPGADTYLVSGAMSAAVIIFTTVRSPFAW